LRLATGVLPMGLVCEGSTLHGSVTAEDLWSLSASELDGPIRDAMNEDPPTVSPAELSANAARRMKRENLRALVVVDDKGEVLGILPRRKD
jgi:CBS domain-containing protein